MQTSSDRDRLANHEVPESNVSLGPSTPVRSHGDNTLCEVLASACGGILGRESVGISDDLFELGIDSILAIQLVSHVNQMFRMDLPPVCLFEAPSVEQLAQYMIAHEARPGLTERTAILLKQIGNMSEEEAGRRLQSKDEPETIAHE